MEVTIKRQPATWSEVTAPHESKIGISFKTEDGERIKLSLGIENARIFCDALNDSLLYFSENGEQASYTFVDRQAGQIKESIKFPSG